MPREESVHHAAGEDTGVAQSYLLLPLPHIIGNNGSLVIHEVGPPCLLFHRVRFPDEGFVRSCGQLRRPSMRAVVPRNLSACLRFCSLASPYDVVRVL